MDNSRDRRACVGASDVPAIMGLDPWRTRWEVWAEKTGRLAPPEPSENMLLGTLLEASLLDHYARTRGATIEHAQAEFALAGTQLRVHVDGLLMPDRVPIEIKTSGLLSSAPPGWSRDSVPDHVLVQVTAQIAAVGAARAVVYALVGGLGLVEVPVPRHDQLVDQVIEAVQRLWWHVETDTPPDDAPLDMEVLARVQRQSGLRIAADDAARAAAEDWRAKRIARQRAEEAEEAAKARLVSLLGCGEILDLGETEITYMPVETRRIDQQLLRRRYPEIACRCEVVSAYRTLRERKKTHG